MALLLPRFPGDFAGSLLLTKGGKVYYEKYAIFALPLTFPIDKKGVLEQGLNILLLLKK